MKINANAKFASLEIGASDIGVATAEDMRELMTCFSTGWEEEFVELLDEEYLEKSSIIEAAKSFSYVASNNKLIVYGPPLKLLALAQGLVMAMQNTEEETA